MKYGIIYINKRKGIERSVFVINIIGTILTGIFLSQSMMKSSSNKMNLPSFRGVIEVRHAISGRIRFYIPKMIENDKEKEILKSQLLRVAGINSMEINTITGSVLACYDEEKIDPTILVLSMIKLLGLEDQIDKEEKPKVLKEIREFGSALNKSVYDHTDGSIDLKTLLPIVLIVWGIKMIVIDQNRVTPQPHNLFWWGYNLLRKG